MSTYDQFLVFINDSVGLERTLRLFQSLALIIASYSTPLNLVIATLSQNSSSSLSPLATRTILLAIIQKLNFARRFFRLFKFFSSFNAAQKLYSTSLDRQGWVDGLGSTFMGLYLLLDASLIMDALKIEGLRVYTPEWEKIITVESQRFWLFALVCGALSGLMKMLDVYAYQPVPVTAEGFTKGKTEVKSIDEKKQVANSSAVTEKEAAVKTKDVKAEKVRRQVRVLQRDVLANTLDIVLPAVVVGWLHVGPGVVGLAMFGSTLLTGMAVWERCGKAVKGGS